MNHFFKFGEKHHALQGRFLGQIEFLQRSGDPAGRRQREIGLGVTHPRPGFGLRRRTHPFFGKMSGCRIGCDNICGSDIGIDSGDSGFRPAHGLLERLRGLPNLELRGIDGLRSGEDHPVLLARNALQSPAHGVLARRGKPDGDQMPPPPSVFKAFFVVLKALTCEHTANAERS